MLLRLGRPTTHRSKQNQQEEQDEKIEEQSKDGSAQNSLVRKEVFPAKVRDLSFHNLDRAHSSLASWCDFCFRV